MWLTMLILYHNFRSRDTYVVIGSIYLMSKLYVPIGDKDGGKKKSQD